MTATLTVGGLLGWLSASGRLTETFAQDKKAEAKAPAAPTLVVDGSILPFPPTPSASTPGLTIADSVYKKRVEPKRLADGAPNILVILMDDLGPGTPSTYGGEINTPTLSRVAKVGVSYNRFHSTAMCSPTRAALLTGRNHTRVCNGQITALANDFDGFSGTIPKSSATVAEVLKCYGYNTGAWGKWHNTPEEHITTKGPYHQRTARAERHSEQDFTAYQGVKRTRGIGCSRLGENRQHVPRRLGLGGQHALQVHQARRRSLRAARASR